MTDWQKIETAPKDKFVMLWSKHRELDIGIFTQNLADEYRWFTSLDHRYTRVIENPTHWQPLPAAPSEEK